MEGPEINLQENAGIVFASKCFLSLLIRKLFSNYHIQTFEIAGFLDFFIRHSKEQKSTTFQILDLFPPSGEGLRDTYSVGPIRKS
jgi:hypothetical protein